MFSYTLIAYYREVLDSQKKGRKFKLQQVKNEISNSFDLFIV